jgi:hypothetical protein
MFVIKQPVIRQKKPSEAGGYIINLYICVTRSNLALIYGFCRKL